MTQEEVDALHMKIAMKQEQHLIPLKEDLADWLNKTLAKLRGRLLASSSLSQGGAPSIDPTTFTFRAQVGQGQERREARMNPKLKTLPQGLSLPLRKMDARELASHT
ncbi:hypothetical protein TNCV_559121 [Trichonephila clavipes]|nr:hypothetical protein TNCV_559121 [Trichonephila clavipes]